MKKLENNYFDLFCKPIRLNPEEERLRWKNLVEKETKKLIKIHGSFENYIEFLRKKDKEFFNNFDPYKWYSIVGDDVKENEKIKF